MGVRRVDGGAQPLEASVPVASAELVVLRGDGGCQRTQQVHNRLLRTQARTPGSVKPSAGTDRQGRGGQAQTSASSDPRLFQRRFRPRMKTGQGGPRGTHEGIHGPLVPLLLRPCAPHAPRRVVRQPMAERTTLLLRGRAQLQRTQTHSSHGHRQTVDIGP